MKNAFIGSAAERREDLRFLRGRGQYVDDLHPDGLLYAVILRSSVAHGRLVSIDASPALKIPGVHAVITAKDMPEGPPIIPMRLQPLPEFKPFEQPVVADKKVRYVGEPMAVVLATSVAIGEDALEAIVVEIEALPPVADWHLAERDQCLLFESCRHQPRADIQRRLRRCRCGLSQRVLYAPREFPRAAPLRSHHGAARRHGRMGRGEERAHGLGRGQSAVLQSPHPGQADRARRNRHRHDRERRRRRLRRARRVLSRGFLDSVRRAPCRAAGEVDRGSPRKPDGDEPRARGGGRRRDCLRARRHHPGSARPRPYRSWAPICVPTARSAPATSRNSWPALTGSPTSSSTCRCG